MISGRHAAASPSAARPDEPGAPALAGAGSGVVVLTPPSSSAVRPRGPLRRQVGVPEPLETPLFVHRAALTRLEIERRRQRRALLAVVASSVAASVALRAVLGG